MRTLEYDLKFLLDILHENRVTVLFGGIAAIAAGFLLGKMSMVFVGGFVILVVSIEFIMTRIFGDRNSNTKDN